MKLATLLPLLFHTLRREQRPIIIWGLVLGALNGLTVAIFPSMSQGANLNAYLETLPPEMIAAFGLQVNLGTIQGWLEAQVFAFFLPLTLGFYPILLGARTVAGAEERGRLDMLLSNPLPRWQLIVNTFIIMILGLLEILLILFVFTWLPAVLLAIELPMGDALAGVFNLLPLCLFFGALALLGSSLVRQAALASALTAGLMFVMYFVNALGKVAEVLEPFGPLTLFHYYGSAIIDGISWGSFSAIMLLAAALATLSVVAFRRRDIYT